MLHNGSNYDYHFFMELTKESERHFEYFGENTERYKTFSLPIQIEDANGKKITYKKSFINSIRHMGCSLSSLVQKGKCNVLNPVLSI